MVVENKVTQEDVNSLLEWANEIADKTGRSIAGIMARFSTANNDLKDVEAAKVKVANELINSK